MSETHKRLEYPQDEQIQAVLAAEKRRYIEEARKSGVLDHVPQNKGFAGVWYGFKVILQLIEKGHADYDQLAQELSKISKDSFNPVLYDNYFTQIASLLSQTATDQHDLR